MAYIVNPKTAGSGVIACIPQEGKCPTGCKDCFFQSGRGFLEPMDENLPNIPTRMDVGDCVVRMNDGNDSGNDIETVTKVARQFKHVFFNTSMPDVVEKLPGPVVLTVNPGKFTDSGAHLYDDVPANLMFVRVRVNTWNRTVVDGVVEYYTERNIPVVLTFMAYDKVPIPEEHREFYVRKTRTKNAYFVLKPEKWYEIADRYRDNPLVYTCGKNPFTHSCHRCGACLREYWHYYDTHRMEGIWPMDPEPEEDPPLPQDVDVSLDTEECLGCKYYGIKEEGQCALDGASENFCRNNGYHQFAPVDWENEGGGIE